jgi:hypothetical protein
LVYRPQRSIFGLSEQQASRVFASCGHAEMDAPPATLEELKGHPNFWKEEPWQDTKNRMSVLLRDPLGNSIGFTFAPFESVYDAASRSSDGMCCS